MCSVFLFTLFYGIIIDIVLGVLNQEKLKAVLMPVVQAPMHVFGSPDDVTTTSSDKYNYGYNISSPYLTYHTLYGGL